MKEHNWEYNSKRVEVTNVQNGYTLQVPSGGLGSELFIYTTFTELVNKLAKGFGVIKIGETLVLTCDKD